jgi:hypothetical protein
MMGTSGTRSSTNASNERSQKAINAHKKQLAREYIDDLIGTHTAESNRCGQEALKARGYDDRRAWQDAAQIHLVQVERLRLVKEVLGMGRKKPGVWGTD